MNINTAQQQFAVTEHHINQQGRVAQRTAAAGAQTADPAESTVSASQNEEQQNDELQPFNALLSIGAVKKILEQLDSGKLLSWIEGSLPEKLWANQAQATSQTAAASNDNSTVTVAEWSYQFQQVTASFTGSAQLEDGQLLQWSFDIAMQSERFSYHVRQQAALQDPLVLSLEQTPVELAPSGSPIDFYGNGGRQQLPDLASGQFYLMQDRNQDRQLNSGLELFGPATGQGFAELATLDQDQNGFIDAQDSAWQQLGLWRADTGFRALADYQIGALSTQSAATPFALYQGEQLTGRIARSGVYLTERGQPGLIQQVDLNI
jgi:hypothetical protein